MPFDRRKLHILALTLTSSIVLAAAASSAHADGGRGGDGFYYLGGAAAGGAGGGDGAAGQAGSPADWLGNSAGAGGGGGGAGGGIGGAGGTAGVGGPGESGGSGGNGGAHGASLSGYQSVVGAMTGVDGSVGNAGGDTSGSLANAGGGGGGGAGGHGLVMTGPTPVSNLWLSGSGSGSATGGDGGNGGRGGNASGGFINNGSSGGSGGSGGDGGVGINFTDVSALLNNSQTVRGGNGGNGGVGGTGVFKPGGNGGGGGAGGAGVRFDATGGTLTNNTRGLIHGGNGGHGGAGGTGNGGGNTGLGGVGGAGVIGAGLTIYNYGSIVGGLGADGTRADAITYTGGTNWLRLAATSNLTGNIGITAAGSTVNFDQREDVTLANVITGLGGIALSTHAQKLTLTGDSTYTGSTTVNGGTLSVNGSIASSSMTTVNAGGTLGGNGVVGNTTINGGTLAPGNSIGLLTVRGSLTLTAASTYLVEVSPTKADRVNVTGTATLGGARVQAHFASGSYVEKQYTIVNAANGVSGTFGSLVNTDLPTGFKTALSYDANNAYLDVSIVFGVPGGLAGNQQAVGDALTGFFNRTGGIPLVFGALDAKGLSQIAGEIAPGSQQTSFDVANIFMTQMTDPFAAGRGEGAPGAMPYADEAMAYAGNRSPTDAFASMHRKAQVAAPQERWNVWAAGFGGSQTTDGNAATGSNNSRSSIYGMAVGADYWFSPFTVAGLSMAGGGTNFSVNGSGSGRSDLFQVGGFIRHNIGSVYVSAAAAYGWQDITTDRTVTVAGLDQLRANFNANSYSGRVEVGNRFVAPWIGGVGLTPYAAFQVTAFELPSYAESVVAGSNTFALTYAGKTTIAPRSELGLRTDKSFAVNDAILTLRGRAAWAHDINRDRSASATFQSLPGASFIVNGAALAKHTALTSASAELKWMNGWSVAGTFEGEFSDVTRSYAGKGVVRYAW